MTGKGKGCKERESRERSTENISDPRVRCGLFISPLSEGVLQYYSMCGVLADTMSQPLKRAQR